MQGGAICVIQFLGIPHIFSDRDTDLFCDSGEGQAVLAVDKQLLFLYVLERQICPADTALYGGDLSERPAAAEDRGAHRAIRRSEGCEAEEVDCRGQLYHKPRYIGVFQVF